LIENNQTLVYLFIFLGLIIEGEFILISAGIFWHLGALNPELTLLFIILGVSSKTFLGYYIGILLHDKLCKNKFFKYIERRVLRIMPHFRKKPFWSIFWSKFILGANNVIIVFSGYERINFKKYLKAEFISTAIWAPIMVALGYIFAYTALNISREIWRFSFIILLMVIGFITIDRIIGWMYVVFEDLYHHEN
jgi:membrane protein DedA with SNARE-associated domain